LVQVGNPVYVQRPRRLVSAQSFGTVFSPASVPGLSLWYDFADATTLFSDAGTTPIVPDATIYQVNDKSGNGRTLSQATAGARPTWKESGLNGRGLARFDGADFFTSPSFAWFPNSTIMVVAMRTSITGTQQLLDGDGTQRNFQTGFKTGAATAQQTTWAGVIETTATTSAAGTYDILSFRRQSNTVGGDRVFVNGVPGVAGNSGVAVTTARVYTLGCTNGDSTPKSAFLIGDVADLVVCDSALSAADHNRLGSYFAGKRGLMWTTVT
jgi:hypothetical protein